MSAPRWLLALPAVAFLATARLPEGFDPAFPPSFSGRLYRQARVNSALKQAGWPYRVYQNRQDGSCLAVRLSAARAFESMRRESDGSPKLAFGCRRLPAERRQELTIAGDMIVIDSPDVAVFTGGEDPYREVGRYEKAGTDLSVGDRARVGEILLWLHRDRGADYVRRVERQLTQKIYDMGEGRMVELTARSSEGRWRYWVKTSTQRPGDPARLFFEDGQPVEQARKDAPGPESKDEDDSFTAP